MARTRTTIRRVDPWSILKFGFVANLVLLGIQLLAGTVIWYVIQRLELIQTVCELAATVGFEECGVDGGALFDTVLVLGLLGVVIQTGILVFLTFLANLIFDLTGGIVVTLEDDRAPSGGGRARAGVGSRSSGAAHPRHERRPAMAPRRTRVVRRRRGPMEAARPRTRRASHPCGRATGPRRARVAAATTTPSSGAPDTATVAAVGASTTGGRLPCGSATVRRRMQSFGPLAQSG